MSPLNSFSEFGSAVAWLDCACRQVVDGRQASRELSSQVRPFELSETEFRLLWLLAGCGADQLPDQRQLASELGLSAAQVSSVVQRLRLQQCIADQTDESDRRRQKWRSTPLGRELIRRIVASVNVPAKRVAKCEPESLAPPIARKEAA